MKNLSVTITKGLPASGKTTWAREEVRRLNGATIVVCRDDLRNMLHDSKFSNTREDLVITTQISIANEALSRGLNVIIAETNLNPKTMDRLLREFTPKATIIIKDFTDVPYEVCIERDAKRINSVGKKVILDMYERYLRPKPVVQDTKLEPAVIFDIDGTLAKMNGRGPFEWTKVATDLPNKSIINLLNHFRDTGYVTIIFSGRDSICRQLTEHWLADNGVLYDELYMRAINENRKDSIIKEELFFQHVFGVYNIEYVVDDRLQVCRMWDKLGLTLLRVGNPDADF